MTYRAANGRCVVNFAALNLPISADEALAILAQQGFRRLEVDLVALARERIGKAAYRRGARLHEAPAVFDCSCFTKWLYGQRGPWLPRRSIQQRAAGALVHPSRVSAGDLLFAAGWKNYFERDPADGVGHVGIATGEDTVIHAANSRAGIVEIPLDEFTRPGFRGARRYLPRETEVVTLITPPEREVETADDMRWIIHQSLPFVPQALRA